MREVAGAQVVEEKAQRGVADRRVGIISDDLVDLAAQKARLALARAEEVLLVLHAQRLQLHVELMKVGFGVGAELGHPG